LENSKEKPGNAPGFFLDNEKSCHNRNRFIHFKENSATAEPSGDGRAVVALMALGK
jgi:hypothetical protein